MPARRCSTCSINYPPNGNDFGNCLACGEQTSYFYNVDPSEDWKYDVAMASWMPEPTQDKVSAWRHKSFLEAGYSDEQAFILANDQTIDLHDAVKLAGKAGPDTAYEILS